jgi:peptide/nickel transport system substrate-binding protein
MSVGRRHITARDAETRRPPASGAHVLLALVFGASLSNCGLTESSIAEGESHALRVLYESDERSLYPAMEDVPRFLIFHPLVRYRSLPDAFCWRNPEPALAARWTPTDGFRTWMIELREDARWHDGEPFTAHDMAFTVELWKHPDVQHWAAAKIDSVSVLGERTVRIFFDRPSRNPLNAWDIWYPKHLLQDFDPAEFWEWEFWRTPVGNGPFRFVTAVSGERAELEAHPLPGPRERRIQRVVLNWGGSALGQLKAGAVDAASLEPSDAAVLRDDPAFVLRFQAYPGGVWIFWNHRNAALAERSVRRALTLAIDRRELHRALELPADLPVTDALHTPCQFATGDITEPLPYDPDSAAVLLDRAGWRDRDGDGFRERAGSDLAFELLAPASWLGAARSVTYVQQRLREVGVDVSVSTADFQVVDETIKSGDFDAVIWIAAPDPPHHLERFGTGGWVGYENPRVTSLLEMADTLVVQERLDSVYLEVSASFREDVPATYLYPKVDVDVVPAGLAGFDPDGGTLLMNLDRLWWVEE